MTSYTRSWSTDFIEQATTTHQSLLLRSHFFSLPTFWPGYPPHPHPTPPPPSKIFHSQLLLTQICSECSMTSLECGRDSQYDESHPGGEFAETEWNDVRRLNKVTIRIVLSFFFLPQITGGDVHSFLPGINPYPWNPPPLIEAKENPECLKG